MANYTNEKLAWEALTNMFGGSKPTPNPALARINLPAPAQPDYSGGWLGGMLGMSGPTPNTLTKGMQADRAAGTDTASRHEAMRKAMPANLPAPPPPPPDHSGGWLGNMLGMSGPTPNTTTAGFRADQAAGTDTASRQNAQMQAGTNVGGGTPIGVDEVAGTNVGGGIPEGVKQSMDKQAIALRANRLHILNTEIARYNPANLIKQAADYPTTSNKQACAYYLGLKKQAAVEKKAFLKALGKILGGAYGVAKGAVTGAAPHVGDAMRGAATGVRNYTVANPLKAVAGGGALGLTGEHYVLPFLGDVANTVKDRYNESAKGFDEFMHRLGRGYKATTADPTSDFSSDGINKAKKVIESVTPKAITSGIIPSKPSRLLEVEEGSIPDDFKSRSLPRDNPQWRSGTRGRDYPRY